MGIPHFPLFDNVMIVCHSYINLPDLYSAYFYQIQNIEYLVYIVHMLSTRYIIFIGVFREDWELRGVSVQGRH